MASSACQQTSRPHSQRSQLWGPAPDACWQAAMPQQIPPWGVPAHHVQIQASNLYKAANVQPSTARTQPEPHMTHMGFRPLPSSWWTSNSRAPDGWVMR